MSERGIPIVGTGKSCIAGTDPLDAVLAKERAMGGSLFKRRDEREDERKRARRERIEVTLRRGRRRGKAKAPAKAPPVLCGENEEHPCHKPAGHPGRHEHRSNGQIINWKNTG